MKLIILDWPEQKPPSVLMTYLLKYFLNGVFLRIKLFKLFFLIHIIKDVFIANFLSSGITEINNLFTFMCCISFYTNSVYKKSIDFSSHTIDFQTIIFKMEHFHDVLISKQY